jgi:hypothetical protein
MLGWERRWRIRRAKFAKNTAQIESAGTATNAHSVGEYMMISNALYKVTASVK